MTAIVTMFASLLGVSLATTESAFAASDSLGSDFWLAFIPNGGGSPELTLFITGPTATTGAVEIPGLTFTEAFTVTPGTVTSVSIPVAAQLSASDTVQDLGIHVTAAAEVTVYGLSRVTATTDAFLGLPTDILGTEYIVQGYQNTNVLNGSEFAVVATQAATTVTIVPSVTTGTRVAGVPYTVTLDQGQTYGLANTDSAPADISGTIVTSDKPVAVFGGHLCANIPQGFVACDHIVEQMTPTVTWGRSFVTVPLATRIGGDTFRYLASTDATAVSVNGTVVATLNRGQIFEQNLPAASTITSDKPILVTQYSNGTSFDGVTSDPFEVIIPPYEQFLNSYTVTTPASGFEINYINVVAPTGSVVTLDGAPIPAASFTAIPGSSFSGAQVSVSLGAHSLGSPQPFGITVYGFAFADSYGYPGGLSLAPVASVTNLDLTPATSTGAVNTEHCSTATVTDQNNVAVVGVRVDFTVTGVNPTSSFTNTGANGGAEFCYTGTVAGDDTIQAAVGTVTDTATRTWTTVEPTTHTLGVGITGSGTVTSSPAGIDCPGTCDADFAEGASVTLTATPAEGYEFTEWSGACTGAAACSVTMSADQSVTAVFTAVAPVTHSIGIDMFGSGTVTSDPPGINCASDGPSTDCFASFPAGSTVTLTGTPAAGWQFDNWSDACEGTGVCTLTLNADANVVAVFGQIPVESLTVTETSAPPTVTAGNRVLQTFTVTNPGGEQTNVVLDVALPAGAVVVSSAPGQGTCTAGPATLSCALGTIAAGGTVTIAVTVTVPAGFPPGVFAPTATSSSDQSGSAPAGPLPGSDVVAPGGGQAFGFVPPGGTITTGAANAANPTAARFTLPNSGVGAPISLTTELTTPTYCGGLACRGRLLTLSPFGGGYDDPKRPPVLDISLDKSVVKRFGPAFRVWVQKEDPNVAPVLVPDCKSLRFPGKYKWHSKWWSYKKGQKIADPSPCVAKRYFDAKGDAHVRILVLQGDPKFGRR